MKTDTKATNGTTTKDPAATLAKRILLSLPAKHWEHAEQKAAANGKTVDQFIEDLCLADIQNGTLEAEEMVEIKLPIPAPTMARLQRVAEVSGRSIDSIVADCFVTTFGK